MPIRMVEDEPGNNSSQQTNRKQSGGRRSFSGKSGLGGSLSNILGVLLPLLLKKPKILIPVVIVGGLIWYFFIRE